MSLTSYRAAPPRGNLAGAAVSRAGLEEGTRCGGDAVGGGTRWLLDLAATYSPTS